MVIPEDVGAALRADTILSSVMRDNYEVSSIQPIAEISATAKERGIRVHTDAVQAFGKIAVSPDALGADLLSVSAHKIYGPRGVGALYIAAGVEIEPLLRCGSHERGLRAGTENAASIHGFGVAAKLLQQEGLPELLPLREFLEAGLSQLPVQILCRNSPRIPNTVNFYSDRWLGETAVMSFDLQGFAVSNGSACAAGVIEPSHVIRALGYNEAIARRVIRVSFGKWTQKRELERFLGAVELMDSSGSGATA